MTLGTVSYIHEIVDSRCHQGHKHHHTNHDTRDGAVREAILVRRRILQVVVHRGGGVVDSFHVRGGERVSSQLHGDLLQLSGELVGGDGVVEEGGLLDIKKRGVGSVSGGDRQVQTCGGKDFPLRGEQAHAVSEHAAVLSNGSTSDKGHGVESHLHRPSRHIAKRQLVGIVHGGRCGATHSEVGSE